MTGVTPGQALAIPAREWNTSLELNDLYRRGGLLRPSNAPGSGLDSNHLLVRNNTGSDLSRWAIVGLGAPRFLPTDNLAEFFRQVVVSGETPTLAAHLGRWALLIEPIPAGKLGLAVAAGVWPTLLRVDSVHHDRADIASGETDLASNYYGAAEILWKEDGTGPKRAVVRISGWDTGVLKAVSTTTIEPGGSGPVTVWRNNQPTTDQVTAWLNWETADSPIEAATELEVRFQRDERKWWIRGVACAASYVPGSHAS